MCKDDRKGNSNVLDKCGLYFRPEDLLTEDDRVSVDGVDRDTNQCQGACQAAR